MSDEEYVHITPEDIEAVEDADTILIVESEMRSDVERKGDYSKNNTIVCPVDHMNIEETQKAVVCDKCGAPHHLNCWVYNNGCGVFKCGGKTYQEIAFADLIKRSETVDFSQLSLGSEASSNLNSIDETVESLRRILRKINNNE